MAGVNDIAFRKVCTKFGADIVYSQMIDVNTYLRDNKRIIEFYDEPNVIAQLLGNNTTSLYNCVKALSKKVMAVDINFGCPDSGVVKSERGSFLMSQPTKIKEIVKKCSRFPLTVKIRAGYDKNHINAVKIAKICEKGGALAIAIHGRARTVNYKTPVDYDIIKKVKDAVNIPVIGNGDIFGKSDLEKMYRTGCDSVMIGRGAIGNPGIFGELKDGKIITKKIQFKEYAKNAEKYHIQFDYVKRHAQWFTKGIVSGSTCRNELNYTKNINEIKKIYKEMQEEQYPCGQIPS